MIRKAKRRRPTSPVVHMQYLKPGMPRIPLLQFRNLLKTDYKVQYRSLSKYTPAEEDRKHDALQAV